MHGLCWECLHSAHREVYCVDYNTFSSLKVLTRMNAALYIYTQVIARVHNIMV